ncbi:TPA: hypothetical protein DCR79_00050 [Patescibacteria group bacterium]|nr:hypothetical protein [Patescibacteria group bacterium]HCR42158.1 hypothetical protein [Patescibacteria group bacterium]
MAGKRLSRHGLSICCGLFRSNPQFRQFALSDNPVEREKAVTIALGQGMSPDDADIIRTAEFDPPLTLSDIQPFDEKLVLASSSGY